MNPAPSRDEYEQQRLERKRRAENVTEAQLLCPHQNFAAQINVNRIHDEKDGTFQYFHTELTVECADCGLPFHFKGLPFGFDPNGATVSVCGLEANLAVAPGIGGMLGTPEENPGGGPGFKLRRVE